jgi:hypothetical protein
LIKIEEAINKIIIRLLEKLKAVTPQFVFDYIHFMAHLPQFFAAKQKVYQPKIRIMRLKFIGYTEHYTTIFRGTITSVMIYLRSDEFKKADKFTLLLMPIKYAKAHPVKTLSGVFTLLIIAGATGIIFQNAEKIVLGTSAFRNPASRQTAEEDVFIEFKNHKFEVKVGGGGGHGAAAPEHGFELYLNIKIEAQNPKEREFLESSEKKLEHNIEALHLDVEHLPLSDENKKKIEETMIVALNTDFAKSGHASSIKKIELKQVLPVRPLYYRQAERMLPVTEINLQIFLEDTHRNRQVWIDFTLLASNRNAVLYLKEHEIEFKDHLSVNVEPVIPQLPVEEEGRLIIKDKIKMELNKFLEKNGIEGKILEVYIDYLMAS